jgi:hypothetical protein
MLEKIGAIKDSVFENVNIYNKLILFNNSFENDFDIYFGEFLAECKFEQYFSHNNINFVSKEDKDKKKDGTKTPRIWNRELFYVNENSILMLTDIGENDCNMYLICRKDDDAYLQSIEKILSRINDDFKDSKKDVTFVKMSFFNKNRNMKEMVVPLKDADFFVDLPFFQKSVLENFTKSREPILILQGDPGTGKTFSIRYFINQFKTKYNFFVIRKAELLMEESFWVDLITDYEDDLNHCLILDDFVINSGNARKDYLDDLFQNLLSVTGGLFNIDFKMILSTNSNMVFNEALKRKGRTFDIVKFRKLFSNEIKSFVGEYNNLCGSTKLLLPDNFESDVQMSPAEIVDKFEIKPE